jgi:hypothetical protein
MTESATYGLGDDNILSIIPCSITVVINLNLNRLMFTPSLLPLSLLLSISARPARRRASLTDDVILGCLPELLLFQLLTPRRLEPSMSIGKAGYHVRQLSKQC